MEVTSLKKELTECLDLIYSINSQYNVSDNKPLVLLTVDDFRKLSVASEKLLKLLSFLNANKYDWIISPTIEDENNA